MNTCSGGQPRYKGIENFLRRLAFNLGNSPSQTDVKIISCIPIDVTDLHQKVICLEKELQCRNNIVTGAYIYPAAVCNDNPLQKCNTAPARPDTTSQISVKILSTSTNNDTVGNKHISTPVASKTDHPTKKCKKPFRTDHLVYHARTENQLKFSSKFRRNTNTNKQSPARSSLSTGKHLDRDRTSDISSPICRDSDNHKQSYRPYESDACSCCRGHFANIDDHIKHYCFVNDVDGDGPYCDSSLYDLVPVRDNIKPKKSLKEATKRINDVYNNMEILNMHRRHKFGPAASERNRLCADKAVAVNVDEIQTDTRKMKTEVVPSPTCYIDCGQIYAKKSSRDTNNCHVNNVDLSKSANDGQRINNEKCLNEIKSILQNVLQELKTSTKGKAEVAETRSSDVKHGRGGAGAGACGPYGGSPYQLGSCSYSYPSAGLCPALQCVHPVIVPPAARARLCSRHLRTASDESAQSSPDKTDAGTDTRDRSPAGPARASPAERSNETDLLIREIYKCLSLDSGESAGAREAGGEVGSSERRFVSRSGTHSGLDRISEIAEKESPPDLTSGESSSSGSDREAVVARDRPKVKDPNGPKPKNFISKIVNFLKKNKRNRGDTLRPGDDERNEDSEVSSDDEYTTVYSARSGDDGHERESGRRPYMEQESRRQWAERLAYRDSPRRFRASQAVMSGRPARSVYWQNVEARPALLRDNNRGRARLERGSPPTLHVNDKPLRSKVKVNKNTGLTWLRNYKSGTRRCGRDWAKFILES